MLLQNHTVINFQILLAYITPQEPQLKRERSLNSTSDQWDCARIRRASDMKQSKLCNIQKKEKFPVSLGTIPRRSQGCWEKKDSVSRFIHELNFIILKGHWPHLDLVLPTNQRKKCYSGVRLRKSWEEGVLQKQHPTYWAEWGAMKGPACLLVASVS